MRRFGRLFIVLALVLAFSFALLACDSGFDNLTDPNTEGTPSQTNDNNDNNPSDLDRQNDAHQLLSSIGYEEDFDSYKDFCAGEEIYLLPALNGSAKITPWQSSNYKSLFWRDTYVIEAQPDSGYYFETWEAYDVLGNTIDTADHNYHWNDEENTPKQHSVIAANSYECPIRLIRPIFTNVQSKLNDTYLVPFELLGDEGSINVSTLPDKIAKNTIVYQTVTPTEGYYITEWSVFYAKENEQWLDEGISYGGDIVLNDLYDEDYKRLIFSYDDQFVNTGRNNTFGIPSAFNIFAKKQSDIIPVISTFSPLHPNQMPYNGEGGFDFHAPDPESNNQIQFIERGKSLYFAASLQFDSQKFYGWYDWNGKLLSDNYLYYIDGSYSGEALYIQYRIAGFDPISFNSNVFTEQTEYLIFNSINSGKAWEVAYNHKNTTFIDELCIPEVYKGLPVTRIADRGFAKSWLRHMRDELDSYQWLFYESHPLIGRLVIPESILEVGEEAFATVLDNGSTSSLTIKAEDTDGDCWLDAFEDITFEIEFLSPNTAVSLKTFSQSGNRFINVESQVNQLLNTLLKKYVNGVDSLSLNIYDIDSDNSADGYYSLENPTTINLSSKLFTQGDSQLFFALFHEFRHFMQFVTAGEIDGASLKKAIGSDYTARVVENLQNYNHDNTLAEHFDQFIEADANAFAHAWFGYPIVYSNLIVRL